MIIPKPIHLSIQWFYMDTTSITILDMVEQVKVWIWEFPTKIGKGGRITIKKESLEALNLKEGTPVWIGIRKQEVGV